MYVYIYIYICFLFANYVKIRGDTLWLHNLHFDLQK